MPVRGAKVRRGKWFDEAERVIQNHGFRDGAPGRRASPGFHFYHRAGLVIQILPSLTRPDGVEQRISSRRVVNVDSILDVVVYGD